MGRVEDGRFGSESKRGLFGSNAWRWERHANG